MKKMMLVAALLMSLLRKTYAQIEKQIPGQAMSADDKKKLEDKLLNLN